MPLLQSISALLSRLITPSPMFRNSLCVALLLCPLLAQTQSGLDNSKWVAFNRAGAPNSKLQCFTPGNVSVSGGNLVISTKVETATCSSFDLQAANYKYTSGFVSMRTFNFLYGTLEFRAKFGGGANTGAWPAVWMLDSTCQSSDPTGTDDRCRSQEIDVAEILDGKFTNVNQQIHIDNFTHNDGCNPATTDTSQNFHVYQLVWSPGSLVFKIDGAVTCTINKRYVPNVPMYVKISMYLGGFGGRINESTLPWTTLIDYVKVMQGTTVVFEDDFNSKEPDPPTRAAPKRSKKKTQ